MKLIQLLYVYHATAKVVMQAALFHVTRVRDPSAMVFAKLLQLLLLFFWLRARRRQRIRAKRRRLLSWDHAFTASASLRWRSTARTTAAVCACLLEGSCINRQLWVRPRSSFSLSRHFFPLRLKPRVARAATIFWNTESLR